MANFDNNMQVIVSSVTSDNPNAPDLRVSTEVEGIKYKAGCWLWKRKDGTPVLDKNGKKQYIGKLERDNYVPKQAPQQAPAEPDFDDSIPF